MPQAAPPRPVILAVDDSADLLALMAKALSADYKVLTAEEGASAIKLALGKPRPDLILLDVEMPGLSGFEVCKMLKANHETADIPVVFLTGKTEKQAEVEGLQIGAVDYVTKPINSAVLKARVRAHVALANQRHELERLVRERTAQLEGTRVELIQRLGRAMQFHESSAVGNRVLRLGHYAKLIAQAAGAKPGVCDMMLKAAPLHDVGKLGVPSEVLRKKEKLSAPDWDQMKRHPQLGADIIGEQRDPLLQLARQLALTHHEHWDGTGYPQGLKGEAIPWPGRVMAVVDSFESMTTTQFYRDTPLPVERAAAEIVRDAGKRYDPAVVEAFKKALPAMTKVRESYADALGDLINLDFSHPRGAGKAPQAPPEIEFPAPAADDGSAQAQAAEAKLKALQDESAEKVAAAEKKAAEQVAAAERKVGALEAELALAKQAAAVSASEPARPDPAVAELREKLARTEKRLAQETEARLAADAETKRLQASLAEVQKAAAGKERPDPALAGAREKLAETEKKLADTERKLAEALQNLETEKKLGQLGVADAAHERQRLEDALKREAEMHAEGERRSAEMAAVRKRIDAALDEAREKLVAVEEKLTQETASRLEAQRALEALRAKLEQDGSSRLAEAAAERKRAEAVLREERDKALAEARAQRLVAEEKAKSEAAARVEGERRSAEMAEVRKRIDAVLGEARERVAAAEARAKEEAAARLAAQQKQEREAAALSSELARLRAAAVPESALAEARKRADAAMEIGKREAQAVEEARKRLAAVEEQLRREAAARAAAEEKLKRESEARVAVEVKLKEGAAAQRAALEIGKREAHAVEEARRHLASAEEKLKRESEARVAAERHAAQVVAAKKAPDPALEEARKRLASAEERLLKESGARAAAEEKLKRESEAKAAAERRAAQAEQAKKQPDPALEEMRKRLAAAEKRLEEETAARAVAESRAAELAREREQAEEALKSAEQKKEGPAADASGGISRQGLVAARRALGKPKEKAGK